MASSRAEWSEIKPKSLFEEGTDGPKTLDGLKMLARIIARSYLCAEADKHQKSKTRGRGAIER